MVDFFHNTLDITETETIHLVIYAALGRGSKQSLGMEDWVRFLSLILRGTIEEKIKYCFSASCDLSIYHFAKCYFAAVRCYDD